MTDEDGDMTESKHTQGPWYVLNRSLPDGATIYGCAGGTGEIIACSIGNESDALTMAASLELLAALEAMHSHFGVLEENHMLNEDARNASRMARAAIAKAKGE